MTQGTNDIDELESSVNGIQEFSEEILERMVAVIKQVDDSLQNIDNSEKLLKENLSKFKLSIESKNNKLKSNKVQIITRLSIVRLQKNITKTQRAVIKKQNKKECLNTTVNFCKRVQNELQQQVERVQLQVVEKKRQLLKGLSPETIKQFYHFAAGESLVGDQCSICMENIEVGRKMIRLDCKHVFCQVCIEGWFADHNTCPNCRHVFHNT